MTSILLIDDDELVRSTIKLFLDRAGYDLLVASDGTEGLDVLSSKSVDVVITDIIMPNRDGIETIVEMWKRSRDISIIAISGGGRTSKFQFLDLAAKVGADYTLKKPFSGPQLIALVERCVSDRRQRGTQPQT